MYKINLHGRRHDKVINVCSTVLKTGEEVNTQLLLLYFYCTW